MRPSNQSSRVFFQVVSDLAATARKRALDYDNCYDMDLELLSFRLLVFAGCSGKCMCMPRMHSCTLMISLCFAFSV